MTFKIINLSYDKTKLIELFEHGETSVVKTLIQYTNKKQVFEQKEIQRLLDIFSFIPKHPDSIDLGEIYKTINPYISPGNNGLIVLPLRGLARFDFYTYPGEIINGRPNYTRGLIQTRNDIKDVLDTKFDSVIVSKPIVFNGLITHSYEPLDNNALVVFLKIPLHITWDSLLELIEEYL